MGTRGPVRKGVGRFVGAVPRTTGIKSPEVKDVFRRIVATVPGLTAADEATVTTLAEATVLQRRAFAEIMAYGLLVPDMAHGGDLRRNPALIIWRTAVEVSRAAAGKLGATPLDRARLGLEEMSDEPSLADVLFGEAANDAGR